MKLDWRFEGLAKIICRSLRAAELFLPVCCLQLLLWPAAAFRAGCELFRGIATLRRFERLPASLRPCLSRPACPAPVAGTDPVTSNEAALPLAESARTAALERPLPLDRIAAFRAAPGARPPHNPGRATFRTLDRPPLRPTFAWDSACYIVSMVFSSTSIKVSRPDQRTCRPE